MPIFEYRAKGTDGKIVRKTMEADDYAQVFNKLLLLNLEPIKIIQVEKELKEKIKKMSLKNVSVFCRQLGTMLESGISLSQAFDILREQSSKSGQRLMHSVYEAIYQGIQGGLSLYEAMLARGEVFPPMLIHMIRAGEASGNLDTVILKTAEYYDSRYKLMNRVNSSMMYPKILLFMIVGIVLALFSWVLPKFFVVFEQLDLKLPTLTKVVIAISDFITGKWYILLFIIVCICVAWSLAMRNYKFAYAVDAWKTKLPIIKHVFNKLAIANFTSTMGVLYSSGVSMLDSLEIVMGVLDNLYYQDHLKNVIYQVGAGKMLSAALEEEEIFEPLMRSMMSIGEESGNLEEMLEKAADFYQSEAEEAIAKLVAMLEPVVIVIIGLLVLMIVGAVIIPTFSMATQISESMT